MRAITAVALVALSVQPVSAHCYSVWHYPQPQRCGVAHQLVRPMPPSRQEAALTPLAAPDLPLPLLEPFVPAPEGPERLKAIGLLTQIVRID